MDMKEYVSRLSVDIENKIYDNFEDYLLENVRDLEGDDFSFNDYDYFTIDVTKIGSNIPYFLTMEFFMRGYNGETETPYGDYILFLSIDSDLAKVRKDLEREGRLDELKNSTSDAVNLATMRMNTTFNRDIQIFTHNDTTRTTIKDIQNTFVKKVENTLDKLFMSIPKISGIDSKEYYVSLQTPRVMTNEDKNEINIMLRLNYFEKNTESITGYTKVKTLPYKEDFYQNVFPMPNKTSVNQLSKEYSKILVNTMNKYKKYKVEDKSITLIKEDELQGWITGKNIKNYQKIDDKLLKVLHSKERSNKIKESNNIKIGDRTAHTVVIFTEKGEEKFIIGSGGIVRVDLAGNETIVLAYKNTLTSLKDKSTISDGRKNMAKIIGNTLFVNELLDCYDTRKN